MELNPASKKAEYNKRYYENHLKGKPTPENVLESQRKYREKNKEKYRELNRLAQQRYKLKQRELAQEARKQ